MSKKLSLWDLYQRQNTMDQQLISHTHHYNDLTGFHSCASTGVADRSIVSDSSNKVKNVLILKNTGGANISFDGSSMVDLSGGVYYASTAGNANFSNNSDTVDGLHAYQMATLSEGGGSHGTAHVLTCRHNADQDGMFKLTTSNGIPVKCDYANNANNANNANTLQGYNLDQLKTIMGGVKLVQRGSTAYAGNITIANVNLNKAFVISVSKGSAGTVAISGSGTIPTTYVSKSLGFSSPGTYAYNYFSASDSGNRAGAISGGTFNISGGSTNLTTKQYSAKLTSSTNLYCDGPVEWQVIEYN